MESHAIYQRTFLIKAYLWATALLYGPLAWAYDAVAWLVSFGYWSRWRLDALGYLKPGSILEIGFGTGELLIELASVGYQVTGLERSPQMHAVTSRKLHKRGLFLRRVCAQAEAMPFSSEMFTNVISTFPSNYLLHEETLAEIRRVLERDGRCVVVGLGVEFKSWFLRRLTNLWLGKTAELMIRHFIHTAEDRGLSVTPITHDADAYTLPVLVLEKSDDYQA